MIRFSELKTIRIAFEVYECQDLSGMEICSHVILRTLKVNKPKQYFAINLTSHFIGQATTVHGVFSLEMYFTGV